MSTDAAQVLRSASDTVVRVMDLHLLRGARSILTGVNLTVARGELVAINGTVRLREDDDPADDRRPRTVFNRRDHGRRHRVDRRRGDSHRRRCGSCGARSAWCFSSIASSSISPPSTTSASRPYTPTASCVRMRSAAGASSSRHSASSIARPRCLASCRAAKRSAWRSPARWRLNPPVLMMDEPTASLDPARRAELGALLHGLLRQDRTLIIRDARRRLRARLGDTRRARGERSAGLNRFAPGTARRPSPTKHHHETHEIHETHERQRKTIVLFRAFRAFRVFRGDSTTSLFVARGFSRASFGVQRAAGIASATAWAIRS